MKCQFSRNMHLLVQEIDQDNAVIFSLRAYISKAVKVSCLEPILFQRVGYEFRDVKTMPNSKSIKFFRNIFSSGIVAYN